MKKIKKIKININGKVSSITEKTSLFKLLNNLEIPLKKVAIELNQQIVNKKNLKKIYLKKNDKVEIVHFIGGG
jgi:sulfur carrier protein